MKYILYLLLAASITLSANDLQEQKEKSQQPEIQVNFNVSNAHDQNAQNTTTSSVQNAPQSVQTIIIKDERSLAKTILHAAVATCVPFAINALRNSQRAAEVANRIISQFS